MHYKLNSHYKNAGTVEKLLFDHWFGSSKRIIRGYLNNFILGKLLYQF